MATDDWKDFDFTTEHTGSPSIILSAATSDLTYFCFPDPSEEIKRQKAVYVAFVQRLLAPSIKFLRELSFECRKEIILAYRRFTNRSSPRWSQNRWKSKT